MTGDILRFKRLKVHNVYMTNPCTGKQLNDNAAERASTEENDTFLPQHIQLFDILVTGKCPLAVDALDFDRRDCRN